MEVEYRLSGWQQPEKESMTDEQGRRTMDKNNFSEIYKKYVMTAYSAAMQVVHNERCG